MLTAAGLHGAQQLRPQPQHQQSKSKALFRVMKTSPGRWNPLRATAPVWQQLHNNAVIGHATVNAASLGRTLNA